MVIYRRDSIRVEVKPGDPFPPPAEAFEIPESNSYERSLDRALEHFQTANARVALFIESEPGTTPIEESPNGEMAVWYRVLRKPGPDIVVPIVECIHWLRTALDHLAYRLAIIVSGSDPPPNENTACFPIVGPYPGAVLTDDKLTSTIGDPTRMSAGLRAAIERAQPYNGGNAPVLAVLRDLDNFAKHRFPPVVTIGGVVSDVKIDQLDATWIKEPVVGPVEDGTEIMRFVAVPGSYMSMKFRCENQIAFSQGKPGVGNDPLLFLWTVRQYLYTDLIPSFEMLPEFT